MPCFITQALNTVRRFGGDTEAEERTLRAVLQVLAAADYSLPPPRIAPAVYSAIYRSLDSEDPYARIKRETNRHVLELLPGLDRRVRASADPFAAAVRLALAGNIIDFGAGRDFDLEATIDRVLRQGPVVDHTDLLRQRLGAARRVLYLADNAGEVVLDRLLLEHLHQRPRDTRIVVAVRGGPTINDATLEDARTAGLDRLDLELIEPGVTLPGIDLAGSSPAFLTHFAQADLIISKGQGNFETLHDVPAAAGRPIFFLFMVKCEVVARLTGLAVGSPLVALPSELGWGKQT